MLKVLFIADVYGAPGFAAVKWSLTKLRGELSPDLVIANGENLIEGRGITAKAADALLQLGVDVITGGNHTFDKKEFRQEIDQCERVLRPLNFPPMVEGRGWVVVDVGGVPAVVVSLQGRTYLPPIDCPFRTLEGLLTQLDGPTRTIIVDFHAEASAEKQALARYFDGRISAVIGTHTHVPTADEQILPLGTGYITDAGMTGPIDSVIGNDIELSIKRFLHQVPTKQKVADGPAALNGVLLTIDPASGNCVQIERIHREEVAR